MLKNALQRAERRIPPRWRVLPDFLIIGAQKAGTTSLYEYVCRHPQVAPATTKEVHFFDHKFEKGIDWYRSHFQSSLRRTYGRWVRRRKFVTGEATPAYLFVPDGPDRVAEIVPRARLIALLRDPVARAYSHYQDNLRNGREPRSFEAAIDEEATRIRRGDDEVPGRGAARWRHLRQAYLARGLYAGQIERWRRRFPREQLLLLDSAEFSRRKPETLDRVAEHVGLAPFDWSTSSRVQKVFNRFPYAPIDAAVDRRLREFFRPYNERLYELVGCDFGWERTLEASQPATPANGSTTMGS